VHHGGNHDKGDNNDFAKLAGTQRGDTNTPVRQQQGNATNSEKIRPDME
jgi:hypothetical protein